MPRPSRSVIWLVAEVVVVEALLETAAFRRRTRLDAESV
jgi:hypothetical protein